MWLVSCRRGDVGLEALVGCGGDPVLGLVRLFSIGGSPPVSSEFDVHELVCPLDFGEFG